MVASRQLHRNRWASTEPFIYSTKKLSRRSSFTIEHELMITDTHTALYKTGLLVDWRQGKEDWRGSVHQDAFSTLRVGEKTMDLFIEADTGTMNHKDMSEKITNYLDYFEKTPHTFQSFVCYHQPGACPQSFQAGTEYGF